MLRRVIPIVYTVLICGFTANNLLAQKDRLSAIDAAKRVTLAGHMHPSATPGNDQGLAESALSLPNLTLALRPTPEQQTALDAFLARQQDPSSPDYHHWLTPEQYADRFGVSQADIDRITAWLKSQNLNVISVARGRNAVTFSGPVRIVEKAFHTEIHRYMVNGELHYANSSEPSIPAALNGIAGGIHGLNDFRPRARKARYTSASGNHYLVPDDIATIYDIKALYNSGIDGTGQKIAIVGQTGINLSDIEQFRTTYNLPANDPQPMLVPGLGDPGIQIKSGDLGEADLDLEWSGAVARKATILFVYSPDVTDAWNYAIQQNLAPVISSSYGLCEAQTGSADLTTMRTYAQQANAQGITWLASAGDNGGADCFDGSRQSINTLSVDAPGSIPEVTSVGGTEFNEGSGAFWNPTNDANQSSAVGYVPEMVWNDSVLDGSPSSGGGGASSFFGKPSWQTGLGVPADNARDVPDVSFASSADHDGYFVFTNAKQGVFGGTSVAAPVFSGMLALLNQYQVSNGFQASAGLGNVNPQLYAMAQSSPSAFHDTTVGNNIVTPCSSTRTCTAAPVGYNAGPGYDQASGLGSLDVFNLVTAWHLKATSKAAVTLSVTSSTASIPSTGSVVLTATVTSGNTNTPTGTITWSLAGTTLGSGQVSGSAGTATTTLTVPGSQLGTGNLSISAVYLGDATFSAAAASVNLTVVSTTTLTITGATNAASFKQVYAPGMILAIFGSALAGTTLSAPVVPLPTQLSGVSVLINGIACPIYFISPTQLNVQIPYSVTVGLALLVVNYNSQSQAIPINITSAAPGIFFDSTNGAVVPNETAKRGDTITLYVTGDGLATPTPATGNVPTSVTTPKPVQAVSVSVGGAAVTQPFPFIGIPSWAIGATQINYTVPMTAPLGKQSVIVTVGGVQSAAASLTITQ